MADAGLQFGRLLLRLTEADLTNGPNTHHCTCHSCVHCTAFLNMDDFVAAQHLEIYELLCSTQPTAHTLQPKQLSDPDWPVKTLVSSRKMDD